MFTSCFQLQRCKANSCLHCRHKDAGGCKDVEHCCEKCKLFASKELFCKSVKLHGGGNEGGVCDDDTGEN